MVKTNETAQMMITASFHMAGLISPLSGANAPVEYFPARIEVKSSGTKALINVVNTPSNPEKIGLCFGLLVSTACPALVQMVWHVYPKT